MKMKEKNPVLMIEDDYRRLRGLVAAQPANDDMSLAYELDRAIIVMKNAFPQHAIRLDSFVSVKDLRTDTVMDFTIVMPHEADMEQKRLSILTPMATALIGFRKAEEVKWRFPDGYKTMKILDVVNKAA